MHLLIACAGSGRRMGAERNKLLLEVAGRPVLAWTLEAALASASIRWIGIVGQSVDQPEIQATLMEKFLLLSPLMRSLCISFLIIATL